MDDDLVRVCIKYWGITFACGFSPPIKIRSRLQLKVGSLSLQLLVCTILCAHCKSVCYS
jgi:hypothetical protein